MKPTPPSVRSAGLLALLATLPALAQAHPGHAALDWFTAAPHLGHESEYAALTGALALLAIGARACWAASRRLRRRSL